MSATLAILPDLSGPVTLAVLPDLSGSATLAILPVLSGPVTLAILPNIYISYFRSCVRVEVAVLGCPS